MAFGQRPAASARGTYARGGVTCPKCAIDILLSRITNLAAEFSMQCPKCGTRGFFQARDVTLRQFPERRSRKR